MIKLYLCIILSHLTYLCTVAQTAGNSDTFYESRPLTLDEVNLVSSYYTQKGNNSAVTGGIGTEALTDFGNNIDLKLSRFDAKHRLHNFHLNVGVDAYSSASSDKIDPNTISSALSASLLSLA